MLRLARHQDIAQRDEHTAVVGGWLQVRCDALPLTLVAFGDQQELRVRAEAAPDGAELVIDYSLQEGK